MKDDLLTVLDKLKISKDYNLTPKKIRDTIKLIERKEKVILVELDTLWQMKRLLQRELKKVS